MRIIIVTFVTHGGIFLAGIYTYHIVDTRTESTSCLFNSSIIIIQVQLIVKLHPRVVVVSTKLVL